MQSITNVINIKSEILFREAEDCFLYFNQIKKAVKKLDEAIELTPNHHKSLALKGDILYVKGKINEALDVYTQANKFSKNDSKILGSMAICLEAKEEYEKAMYYCDKAFFFINENNCQILQSLYELKISILLKLKEYEKAEKMFSEAKYNLSVDEIVSLKSHKEVINLKLRIREKLKTSNLQVL